MSDTTSPASPSDVPTPPATVHHVHAPTRGLGPTVAIVLLIVVLAVGIGFAGVAIGSSRRTPAATITVTGSGTIKGTPDTLSFQIGVQTQRPTAAAALSVNNARVSGLERALSRHGVTRQDMQTSNLSLYEDTNDNGQLVGFTVSDDLNVTLHKIADAGRAIDAAANAAGPGVQLSGITFSISNDSTLLAHARARAMQNAKTEATDIAKGGGTSVGAIVRVTDQENSGSSIVYPFADAYAATSAGVPIEAGSESLNVQVTVVYALAS